MGQNHLLAEVKDCDCDNPNLPQNMGFTIQSQSPFKFGIESDWNGLKLIEIDWDCE